MTMREFLAEATEAAATGSPREVTVRELIAHWGAKGRGSAFVAKVREDLQRSGLSVEPDFRKVPLDSPVKVVQRTGDGSSEPSTEEIPDFGLTLGTLPSAAAGVERVTLDATLAQAQTLMLLNDYSQLAVMSGERSLRGAVTWQSIAEALMQRPDASVADAMVPVQPVRYDDDLLRLVPAIVERNFVFVQDETGLVTGIVTTANLSELFAERSQPFLLIGEIDQRLRDLLRRHFSLDEIRGVCGRDGQRPLSSFDDLTVGDYEQVLGSPTCWAKLEWPLDRRTVLARLTEVRETRNDVMHFNPDPIDSDRLQALVGLVELLRRYV